MKKHKIRLVLTTVRVLDAPQLVEVAGGATYRCVYDMSLRANCCTRLGSGCTAAGA